METFAVSELLKSRLHQREKPNLTFFRDKSGFEIDTIADWRHTFAIEVKSAHALEAKLSANTRKCLALRNDSNVKSAVFYMGDVRMEVNDTLYVPWQEWREFSE